MKKDIFCTTFGKKMYVMELNGRKNITEAIVRKFIEAWMNSRKASADLIQKIYEDEPTMKYIRNAIQCGTIEEKHTVFSEECQKEFGKVSEDWYYVSTKNSGGGYGTNEVVWINE